RPFLQQRIRELLSATCSAADQSIELRANHDARQSLRTPDGDLRPGQRLSELGAREVLSMSQRLRQHWSTAARNRIINLEPAVPVRVRRVHPRTGERYHPADVAGSYVMPGRAQNVGANDRTIVDLFFDLRVGKAFGALGDAPLGRRVVLGL